MNSKYLDKFDFDNAEIEQKYLYQVFHYEEKIDNISSH